MMTRVVILRDPGRAAGLLARLAREGVDARAVPVTVTEDLAPSEEPRLAVARWIVLTSPQAVVRYAAVRGQIRGLTKVATLAAGTAREARALLGREPDLASGATGAELAEALLAAGVTGPVVWPCAEKTAGGLAERLDEAGCEVIRWPLYRTRTRDAAVIREDLTAVAPWDAAVFLAPSAVRAFAAAWSEPWAAPSVAIGPTTADALREQGCARPVVAEAPDEENLTAAVLQALDRD